MPGGHLFKGHTLSSNGRQGCTGGSDEDLEAGWLKGKKHPVTGEPLRIFRPALPPGSMASILTYSPHGVAPRAEGSGTRWASLFAYASPDPERKAKRLRHWPFADCKPPRYRWHLGCIPLKIAAISLLTGGIDLKVPGAENLMAEF